MARARRRPTQLARAPESAWGLRLEDTAFPASGPDEIPTSSLRLRALPADLVVPARVPRLPEDAMAALDRAACRFFLYVDGRSTVVDIARRTKEPVPVVQSAIMALVAAGLVVMAAPPSPW